MCSGWAGGGVLCLLPGEGGQGVCRGGEAAEPGLHQPARLQGGAAQWQGGPPTQIRQSGPGQRTSLHPPAGRIRTFLPGQIKSSGSCPRTKKKLINF